MQFWTRISVLSVAVASISGSSAWACLVPSAAGGMAPCPPCAPGETASESNLGLASKDEGVAITAAPMSAGLAGGLPGGESVVTVHIFNFDFSTDGTGSTIIDPVINAGDTVHWINDSGFHSVTSVAGSAQAFNFGPTGTVGATFDVLFSTPGTYEYYCNIHGFDNGNGTAGGMAGFVTVRAVPEPMSLAALALPLVMRRRR